MRHELKVFLDVNRKVKVELSSGEVTLTPDTAFDVLLRALLSREARAGGTAYRPPEESESLPSWVIAAKTRAVVKTGQGTKVVPSLEEMQNML